MKTVSIGHKNVGPNSPTFIIAEIGINHNGDLELTKRLIDVAVDSGCDAVKFQKRTLEVVYTPEELAQPREHPFGTTNGDLKRRLEFGRSEYAAIDRYCRKKGIMWFASCWDEDSVDFIDRFEPPAYKIASASLTDDDLLKHTKSKGRPVILSTGMSNMPMIEHAVDILGQDNLIIMHCTSTYPGSLEELNLRTINGLQQRFEAPIGYSGHEVGLIPSLCAAVLGARAVERHITLDRAMFGSDQAASVEPRGISQLVKYIRAWELAKGDGRKVIYDSEKPVAKKLRRKWGVWEPVAI